MPLGFILKADLGMDLDTDELGKSPRHAAFIKNMSRRANDNPAVQNGSEGNNIGVWTPNESNELVVPVKLPEGDNFCIGYREDHTLNEGYVFFFNSRGNHGIYRINGSDGSTQIVKIDRDFNFQLDPRYFITPRRCTIVSYCVHNKATGLQETRKDLIFTDFFGPMRYINVEDCIATGGFDAARFPFFSFSKPYKEYLINQGLPYSFACIGITPVPPTDADKVLDNRLDNLSIQFRITHFDVWNRQSEHGVISQPYFNAVNGCLAASIGRTRCLDLSIDAGPPTINRIAIEFRVCNANTQGLSTSSDWFEYEVIEKYDQSDASLSWWQRKVNPDLKYDSATNRITYRFCKDKGCKAIPVEQTNRVMNPIPIVTGSVVSINKSIAVANNRKKYPPLTKSVLKNLSFSVEKPAKNNVCSPKGINITTYAVITTIQEGEPVQPIRKMGDNIVFGADKDEIIMEIGQVFPKGQEGFIGYFAGTSEYVISKQCAYNKETGEIREIGLTWDGPTAGDVFVDPPDPSVEYPIQKFEFKNVTPGKKVFRIASHKAAPTDDYQRTSTHVHGLTSFETGGKVDLSKEMIFELVINACDKDVDLRDSPFLIFDLTSIPGGVRRITNSVTGYIYEDEVSKVPIEQARVSTTKGTWLSKVTDHNGFFWANTKSKGWKLQVFGTKNGQRNQLLAESRETTDSPGSRFREEVLYVWKGDQEFKPSDRILIKGKVQLCNSNTGLGGVLVVLTRGAYAVSDTNGNFTIVAHDGVTDPNRQEKLIVAQGGSCIITTCGNSCSYCFTDIAYTAPGINGGQERVFLITPIRVNLQNLNLRGPQNGGRYPLSIQAFDWLGRTNGAEALPTFFIDIPSIQETGVFAFSKIKYKFAANTVFPSWVKHITIGIGRNQNWGDFMTWYADKVELIDNSGKVNKVNPTQIKVYYRGMVEYNIQNNFSTNATWQLQDDEGNVITGDRVEFIANGDGKIFTTRITALVKHDKDGQFFTIDYMEELKNLTDGAMVKILRPRDCTTTEQFNEHCLEIELVDGKVPTSRLEGYIDFVDSYMFNRQIPIPQYDDKNEKVPALTQVRNVPLPFEHHSPSDFWGDHCSSRGRAFVKDIFANVQCRSTEIGVSKALANDGVINGLSYFDDEDFREFDKNEWGAITAVIPLIRGFLVICEHDNFLVAFDDNAVRVRGDKVIAAGAGQRFGDPETKPGAPKYGCQLEDINTICEHQGGVMYLDGSCSAWVFQQGSQAVDMSVIGCSGWLKDKIKHRASFNQQNKGQWQKYFHAAFNIRSHECILTSFVLPVYKAAGMNRLTDDNYVNQLREINIESNESVGLDPFAKEIVQHYSFTPEYFGTLAGHVWDKQLISFKGAQPYIHHKPHNRAANSYLKFFGRTCEPIYEVVLNVEDNTSKMYLWTQVYCREQLFFCDRILTHSGQMSRLLKAAFDKRLDFWSAEFRGDLNTVKDNNSVGLRDGGNVLYEGDSLYGNWIKVRYVGDPKVNGKYFEFNGVTIHVNPVDKSGK